MVEPVEVSASEAELIGMVRALVMSQRGEARARLLRARPLALPISTRGAALIGDTLAQVWPALWRRGGVRPGEAVVPHDAAPARGRIWERHAPVGLAFSAATFELLRWLIELPLASPVAQPLVASPLAWLGFADLLGTPDCGFDSLCHGAGAIVVEALAGELARRWRAVELSKRAIVSPEALIALGAAQDATLRGFMAACDRVRRRDLAGFVIDAAAPLVARGIAPVPAQLAPTATLASRGSARLAAGALLRGVIAWAAWDQGHRGVRFIDDDYAAAQQLLARFEAIAAVGTARAAAWLAELAALTPTAPRPAATVDAP